MSTNPFIVAAERRAMYNRETSNKQKHLGLVEVALKIMVAKVVVILEDKQVEVGILATLGECMVPINFKIE